MDWNAFNNRFCGVLINFSMREGLVLFKENKIDKMEIGSYLTVYLNEKSGNSAKSGPKLLGRVKNMYWKAKKLLKNEYGLPDWEERYRKDSFCIEEEKGVPTSKTIGLKFGGDPLTIGEIDFIGVPPKIPSTWMKVFEASESEIEGILGEKNENSGFKIKINSEKKFPIDFKKEQFINNILIIGSYENFLSLTLKEILKFPIDLPKIVFTQRADTGFSDFDRISIQEFQKLVSNGFGFEYSSDEQILNAATSLNPPQIRLLSNLLVQAKKDKKRESKLKTLRRVINKNIEAYNGRYEKDLEKILSFLEVKWDESKNLNSLMSDNKTIIVEVLDERESKQIELSKFFHAVIEEISNRKRNKAPPLGFFIFIEDIEEYIPSNFRKNLDSDKKISKEAFKKFISHPDTNKIGLIMSTCFLSRIDPLIYYLCPNRLFGEVFEKRELIKIKEVFGIEEIEIRNLRNISRREDEWGILLNFPSRFPVDVVDGVLAKGRWYK
ncbi:MAG: hypothetical protein PVF58_06930 [Candidatus Methanofastidiosia archaeon]